MQLLKGASIYIPLPEFKVEGSKFKEVNVSYEEFSL
jgi:hypothetical protein